MDKKYRKLLLEELYRDYPEFSKEWIDRLSAGLPLEDEQKRNMAWLKEKHFIEQHPMVREYLKITADGVSYLEQLKKELQQKEGKN